MMGKRRLVQSFLGAAEQHRITRKREANSHVRRMRRVAALHTIPTKEAHACD
jgi:hypothetical protein